MPKPKMTRPTDSEIAILRVLWKLGPSTVRVIHEQVGGATGYTTVLKTMQLMAGKGLLERDERERTHIYRPAQSAEATQKHLIRDLVDRAFSGSPMKLVMQALSTKKMSPEELAELKKLIQEMEGKKP